MSSNEPKGSIEALSVCGYLLSGILFVSAALNGSRIALSLSLLGASASTGGIVAATLFDRHRHLQKQLDAKAEKITEGEQQLTTLKARLEEATRTITFLQNLPPPVDRTPQIIEQYRIQIEGLQSRHQRELDELRHDAIAQIESVQTQSQVDLDRLRAEIVDADTQISEFETRFIHNAQQTLSDALNKLYDRVLNLVRDNLRKAGTPDAEDFDAVFYDRVSDLDAETAALHESYVEQIMSLSDFLNDNSILDCSDEALSILYHLTDDFTSIKIKVINALKAKALRELQAVITAYKQAELVPKAHLEQIIANLRTRLQEYEMEASQHQQSVVAIATEYESQTVEDDRVVRSYIDKMARLEHDNQQLKEQVAALAKLKRFDEGAWGWGATIGNYIIDYLMAENIPCDAIPLNFSPNDTHITIALECRTEAGLRMLKKEATDIQKGMQASKGWKDVKLKVEGRILKAEIEFANRAIAKTKPEAILERSSNDWQLYLGSEYHWAIFAATQSGKTTLIDELDALLHVQFGGEVEFNAVTLKTDGNRDSDEKAKRFIFPLFKTSNQSYYEAMCDVLEEIESRKLILAVNPNHRYKRAVFQWDEYGEHFRLGGMREETKQVLISALQVGAGLSSESGKGVQVTFIAQNPLVSQLGLNRPDLANCCLVVVGEKNIRLFLNSDEQNHGLDGEDLTRLKAELSTYKEASRKAVEKARSEAESNGEDPRLAIAKCRERYYSLVIPSKGGLKPIILYNPAPGEFTNQLTGGTTTDAAETCEHEFKTDRTRLIENKTKRQREQVCKKCGFKQKTIEPVDPPKSGK